MGEHGAVIYQAYFYTFPTEFSQSFVGWIGRLSRGESWLSLMKGNRRGGQTGDDFRFQPSYIIRWCHSQRLMDFLSAYFPLSYPIEGFLSSRGWKVSDHQPHTPMSLLHRRYLKGAKWLIRHLICERSSAFFLSSPIQTNRAGAEPFINARIRRRARTRERTDAWFRTRMYQNDSVSRRHSCGSSLTHLSRSMQ